MVVNRKRNAVVRHPNSLKNLKPYKPGETGNPGGCGKERHRGYEIALRAIFENDSEAIYRAFAKAA